MTDASLGSQGEAGKQKEKRQFAAIPNCPSRLSWNNFWGFPNRGLHRRDLTGVEQRPVESSSTAAIRAIPGRNPGSSVH
ncbi:MAG: hypothetical protein WBA29_16040 [Xanthobacteraceae bacterium]